MKKFSLFVLLGTVCTLAGCGATSSVSEFTPATANVESRRDQTPATREIYRRTRVTIGGKDQEVIVRTPLEKEDKNGQ